MEGDLVAIGSDEWLLADDMRALRARRKPSGVRLLPARDPFLQQRDRERLLSEKKERALLWRPVRAPGLLMLDGEAAAIWKASRERDNLTITVQSFAPPARIGPARSVGRSRVHRTVPWSRESPRLIPGLTERLPARHRDRE
jgi:hypothetical protein